MSAILILWFSATISLFIFTKRVYLKHIPLVLYSTIRAFAFSQLIAPIEYLDELWKKLILACIGEIFEYSEEVTGIRIKDTVTGEKRDIPVQGFFVAIGHKPNTDIFK